MIVYKKFSLILSMIFLLTASGYAQYDFRRGSVITNENDTISGFIDYTTPDVGSNYCFFKKDSSGEVVKYAPTEIKAYKIPGYKYFVSKNVTIDDISGFFFLEYLLEGTLNLYYLGHGQSDLYFVEKDNKMFELTNDEAESLIDGQRVSKNSNRYIGTLKILMSDANGMQQEINSTRFNHTSLIQLTKDYHDLVCKDRQCIVYYRKQKKLNDAKIQFRFGVLAEYIWSYSDMHFTIIEGSPSSSAGYENYYGFTVKDANGNEISETNYQLQAQQIVPGIFININRNKRFSVQFELKYQDMKYKGLEFKKVQFPVFFIYDLTRYKKLIPYLKTGFVNDFYLDTKNEGVYLEYYKLDEHSVENYPYDTPVYNKNTMFFQQENFMNNFFHMSLAYGLGIKYYLGTHNFIGAEVKYNRSYMRNISYYGGVSTFADSDIVTKINNIAVIVSYSF